MIKSIDKKMKILLVFCSLGFVVNAGAQQLSLDEAYTLAKTNYPVIKKRDLIKQSTDYSLQNAGKAYLPQVSINGQATYQSEVTRIPVTMPGVKEMSKDQYKLVGEVSQLLYDGGAVSAQREILKANEAVQLQNVEVAMQSVKERVTDMYFGILLMEEQLAQNKLRKESLNAALKKAEAAYANGVSFKSNVNELKAEVLNVDMSATEIKADQNAYKDMLSQMIGRAVEESTVLIQPATLPDFNEINRPETKLYDLQKNIFDAQRKKLQSDWLPKISSIAQGGYGRPGMNMLSDKFEPFAIGGIRFTFPLNNIYTWKNNLKINEINQRQVDADKETFLLNTNATLKKQLRDQQKYEALISEDDKIIELREEITKSARAQLDNNVITVSEFINKLNTEHQARQMKYLHQLQLLKAKYNFSNTSGY